MQIVDIEFLVSDDTVNCYGYRLLSSGFMPEAFKPRIGYLMHDRCAGVAVKWEDLKIEGSEIYATPVINDVRFPNLLKEIQEGFYLGASVGHIVALEYSDDPSMKLAGQTGPTVTKWYCREISIVDVPGNYNALAKLYDEEGNVLMDLSDRADNLIISDNMSETKFLNTADYAVLNLSADATAEQVSAALQSLANRANRADEAEKKYADLVAKHNQEKVEAIVAQALADGKMYPAMAEHLKKHYAEQPDALAELVATMPKQVNVKDLVGEQLPAELVGKSYNDLFISGDLERVKKEYPNYFKKLEEEQA